MGRWLVQVCTMPNQQPSKDCTQSVGILRKSARARGQRRKTGFHLVESTNGTYGDLGRQSMRQPKCQSKCPLQQQDKEDIFGWCTTRTSKAVHLPTPHTARTRTHHMRFATSRLRKPDFNNTVVTLRRVTLHNDKLAYCAKLRMWTGDSRRTLKHALRSYLASEFAVNQTYGCEWARWIHEFHECTP